MMGMVVPETCWASNKICNKNLCCVGILFPHIVEKIKANILCKYLFFRKSCRLWENLEKCGRAGQTTDDNTIECLRFACWITKATDTHSEYVIFICSPRQHWLRERTSRYVTRTLPLFFDVLFLSPTVSGKWTNRYLCCLAAARMKLSEL